jgi:hypothetical protein
VRYSVRGHARIDSNIQQLSSSGKAAKDKRAAPKKAREERERKEKGEKEAEAADEDDGAECKDDD